MADLAAYIYGISPVAAATLGLLGGLIMSLSKRHMRIVRGFVIASAFPLILMPITLAWTYPSPLVGFSAAGISTFILAMIYSVGISVLNEHLKRADKTSTKVTS